MENIPQVSEQAVRAFFDAQSWQRGRQYARDGAIIQARRQGRTLRAACVGSLPEPYRVEATFNARGLSSAGCSCPVGEERYCKHIAALLITWLDRPDTFREAEETHASLQRRDKDELIALIMQMLRRQPELESLLDMPLPGVGTSGQPARRETFSRQVAIAFQHGGHDWGAETKIARDILPLIEVSNEYLQRRDYTNAATVFEAVSAAIIAQYGSYSDENGSLEAILYRCVEGMLDTLSGLSVEPATRAMLLPALFAIYHADVESGRSNLSDEIATALVDHLTADERRTVAGWVREALPGGKGWADDYHRQEYGAFLLDLEVDELDDEAFLRLCRETSRTRDLIERLLTLGRIDDAERETADASDYDLIGLADLFVEHRQGAVAERLMRERAATAQDSRLTEWLKTYYAKHGNTAGALDLAEKLFRTQPRFDLYTEMRTLTRKGGAWDTLRTEFDRVPHSIRSYPNARRHLPRRGRDRPRPRLRLEAIEAYIPVRPPILWLVRCEHCACGRESCGGDAAQERADHLRTACREPDRGADARKLPAGMYLSGHDTQTL